MSNSVENEMRKLVEKIIKDVNEMAKTNFSLMEENITISLALNEKKIKYGNLNEIRSFLDGFMLGTRIKR